MLRFRRDVVEDGSTLDVDETAQLHFSIEGWEGSSLQIGPDMVPMVPRGKVSVVDPEWVKGAATEHLVGNLAIEVRSSEGEHLLGATLRRSPSRMTLEQYQWMLDFIVGRTGLKGLEDPNGRAQIWAMLAPVVPDRETEEAMAALLAWRRSADAIHRIATNPQSSLSPQVELVEVDSARIASARKVLPSGFQPWDPPRPLPRPRQGTVLVESRDLDFATPENRYVVGVMGRLWRALAKAATTGAPAPARAEAAEAKDRVSTLFTTGAWTGISEGPMPSTSFVLRDHPSYHSIVELDRQLAAPKYMQASLDAMELERALELSPWSLNVLYQRWITTEVLEWLERRLPAFERPAVPTSGIFLTESPVGTVQVVLDEQYPRTGLGVHVPTGKNRPDMVVEVHTRQGVRALVIDPTYSKNRSIHEAKFQYAINIRDGGRADPIDKTPALCAEWVAAAFPGASSWASSRRPNQAETLLSLVPGDSGRSVLFAWLDATIGTLLAG